MSVCRWWTGSVGSCQFAPRPNCLASTAPVFTTSPNRRQGRSWHSNGPLTKSSPNILTTVRDGLLPRCVAGALTLIARLSSPELKWTRGCADVFLDFMKPHLDSHDTPSDSSRLETS